MTHHNNFSDLTLEDLELRVLLTVREACFMFCENLSISPTTFYKYFWPNLKFKFFGTDVHGNHGLKRVLKADVDELIEKVVNEPVAIANEKKE